MKKVLGLSEEQAAAFSVAREKGEALEQAVMFFFVSLVFCVSCVFLLSFLSLLLLLSFLSFLSFLFLLLSSHCLSRACCLRASPRCCAECPRRRSVWQSWSARCRTRGRPVRWSPWCWPHIRPSKRPPRFVYPVFSSSHFSHFSYFSHFSHFSLFSFFLRGQERGRTARLWPHWPPSRLFSTNYRPS